MTNASPYAIIKTGSKQYRVEPGDIIDVELLDIEGKDAIEFKDILLFHNGSESKVGAPFVENALVKAEVVGAVRGPKVISYKYKKRKNYHRKVGHRQNYIRLKITDLTV